MLDLELSGQPACGQPDVASQTTIPVYRTRYGRAVKNHPSDFFKGGGDEEQSLKLRYDVITSYDVIARTLFMM